MEYISLLAQLWGLTATFMTIAWGFYLIKKNPGVVDIFWSLGLILCGFWIVGTNGLPLTLSHVIGLCALTLWGLRLAGFIAITRIAKGEKDKRYTAMKDNWEKGTEHIKYWMNYQIQAAFQVLLATAFIPFFTTLSTHAPQLLVFSLSLFFIALVGETIADIQLHQFKSNPENKGQVCKDGLWFYSRHPNYFFEWLIWVSFAGLSLSVSPHWIALISPITLYIIFNVITGPITEKQSLKSKGDLYRHYQITTNKFFLGTPKQTPTDPSTMCKAK